jgi:RHS repeat-associated protein
LTDALGSTLALTDTGGAVRQTYSYEPYGEVTASGSSDNPYQYTGRENDGTGLYYYRARYYSPALKRFVSEDPMGLAAGLNSYAYVHGNPISATDPLGLLEGWTDPSGPPDMLEPETPLYPPQLPNGYVDCLSQRRWDWSLTIVNLANSAGNAAAGTTGTGIGTASHATTWQHSAGSAIGQAAQRAENGRSFGPTQAKWSSAGKMTGRLLLLPTIWEGYWDLGSELYCTCGG